MENLISSRSTTAMLALESTTERSKAAILLNFMANCPNHFYPEMIYLAEKCAKYEYDIIRAYYDEYYDCIDVTMKIKDDLIIITRWFDDEEEYMVEIYNKDKKSICVVGSKDSVKKYFKKDNWRENFV